MNNLAGLAVNGGPKVRVAPWPERGLIGPQEKDAVNALFDEAIRHDVAFVPGLPFFAEGDVGSHMRLNFSNATPEMIREGIRRLSIAVAHEVEHTAGVTSLAVV